MLRLPMAAVILMAAPSFLHAEQETALKIGQPAPTFTMTGMGGKAVKLSEKMASGDTNIVLLFSRANW